MPLPITTQLVISEGKSLRFSPVYLSLHMVRLSVGNWLHKDTMLHYHYFCIQGTLPTALLFKENFIYDKLALLFPKYVHSFNLVEIFFWLLPDQMHQWMISSSDVKNLFDVLNFHSTFNLWLNFSFKFLL